MVSVEILHGPSCETHKWDASQNLLFAKNPTAGSSDVNELVTKFNILRLKDIFVLANFEMEILYILFHNYKEVNTEP